MASLGRLHQGGVSFLLRDSADLQLSNFALLENRETLDFEVYMNRYGEKGAPDYCTTDAYRYTLKFG